MHTSELDAATLAEDLAWLRPKLLEQIPLAQAMQLEISELGSDRVVLSAPLAPNVNDKGCAFGGSIGALLTLAGWSLLTLHAQRARLQCGIYIQDSQLRYLKPAWSAMQAHAHSVVADMERFVTQFIQRGRSRIELVSVLYSDGVRAAEMQARYVALPL